MYRRSGRRPGSTGLLLVLCCVEASALERRRGAGRPTAGLCHNDPATHCGPAAAPPAIPGKPGVGTGPQRLQYCMAALCTSAFLQAPGQRVGGGGGFSGPWPACSAVCVFYTQQLLLAAGPLSADTQLACQPREQCESVKPALAGWTCLAMLVLWCSSTPMLVLCSSTPPVAPVITTKPAPGVVGSG